MRRFLEEPRSSEILGSDASFSTSSKEVKWKGMEEGFVEIPKGVEPSETDEEVKSSGVTNFQDSVYFVVRLGKGFPVEFHLFSDCRSKFVSLTR